MNDAFLLQMNPNKEFRLYEAIHNIPLETDEIVLYPGRSHTGHLIRGTKIYLWEAGGRDLVGEGTIIQNVRPTAMPTWQHRHYIGKATLDPKQPRVIVRIEKLFTPRIKREQIQGNTVLANATFFNYKSNTTGTCFQIRPDAARELAALLANSTCIRFPRELACIDKRPAVDPASTPSSAPIQGASVNRPAPDAGEEPQQTAINPVESTEPPTEAHPGSEFDAEANEDTRERQQREVVLRPGQAQFKLNLLDAYSRRCAITDCEVGAVLEAAHIRPYRNEACHHITNGLLLRADIHALFDAGLITIGENWGIEIAISLRASEYGSLENSKLRLPAKEDCHPSKQALALHRSTLGKCNSRNG